MSTVHVHAALGEPSAVRGLALAAVPEDQWFERKSAMVRPAKVAEAMVGFANAEGGVLVIGITDGAVTGVDRDTPRVNEFLQAGVDHTYPPVRARHEFVEVMRHDGTADHLLVFEVDPSDIVHATTADECFLRVGDETRKLTFSQRQELLYDKGQSQFDGTVVPTARVQELDQDLLSDFAQAVGHPDPQRVLHARNLLSRKGEVTAAAYLLFAPSPQDTFPEAYVRVLRYAGSERGSGRRQQLVHDQRCEGPIPALLAEAREAVRELQPTRRRLGRSGRFETEGMIPEDAWLEGLVNAVVHRSYSLGGDHIRVEVFNDRIEVESPGRFPGLVQLDEAKAAVRFARNPRVARVCADLNFGQELGEGIRRMFDEMRLAGLSDPLYQQTAGSVRLTLSATAGISAEDASRLPSRSREVFEFLRETGAASTGEVASAIGLSKPAVLTRLNGLKDVGLIDWVGQTSRDPRAYWKLHSE